MTCCYCAGPVELPERGYPAWCPACRQTFYLAEDLGFFHYTIEVYMPSTDRADIWSKDAA